MERFGAALAACLRPGECVALSGPLGAGKTALARGFVRAFMAAPALSVPSPTFAIAQLYERGKASALWHVDLYRLRHPSESREIGWEEALRAGASVIVEWPERDSDALPPHALWLTLEIRENGRIVTPYRTGNWLERLESLQMDECK